MSRTRERAAQAQRRLDLGRQPALLGVAGRAGQRLRDHAVLKARPAARLGELGGAARLVAGAAQRAREVDDRVAGVAQREQRRRRADQLVVGMRRHVQDEHRLSSLGVSTPAWPQRSAPSSSGRVPTG